MKELFLETFCKGAVASRSYSQKCLEGKTVFEPRVPMLRRCSVQRNFSTLQANKYLTAREERGVERKEFGTDYSGDQKSRDGVVKTPTGDAP